MFGLRFLIIQTVALPCFIHFLLNCLYLFKGAIERPSSRGDCRTNGCGSGATCVAQGDVYVCRCSAGLSGDPEVKCIPGKIHQSIKSTNY